MPAEGRSLAAQYEEARRAMNESIAQVERNRAEQEAKRHLTFPDGTPVRLTMTYGYYSVGAEGVVRGTYRSISHFMCSRVEMYDGFEHNMCNYQLEATIPEDPSWEV